MRLLIGLLIAVAFVALFKGAIRKAPVAFYALAAAAVAFYLYGVVYGLPAWLWKTAMFLLQKNIFAFSLFTVVMFIGVLPNESALRKALAPIRGELSIIACILSLGHMLVFGYAYFGRMFGLGAPLGGLYFAAALIALVVAVVMAPLFLTSFKAVRSRMSAHAWKRVQWLAYPFFLLAFAHVFLFIAPSSLQGGVGAVGNVFAYALVLAAYAALRMRKALRDSREKAQSDAPSAA